MGNPNAKGHSKILHPDASNPPEIADLADLAWPHSQQGQLSVNRPLNFEFCARFKWKFHKISLKSFSRRDAEIHFN